MFPCDTFRLRAGYFFAWRAFVDAIRRAHEARGTSRRARRARELATAARAVRPGVYFIA